MKILVLRKFLIIKYIVKYRNKYKYNEEIYNFKFYRENRKNIFKSVLVIKYIFLMLVCYCEISVFLK